MIIEISISISANKYGPSLANTELKLDSDFINPSGVMNIASGMVESALSRAHEKLKTQQAASPDAQPDKQ